MFNPEQLKLLTFMQQCSKEQGVKIYVVGGVIRDIFLGESPKDKDIDFIVEGDAISFAEYCNSQVGGELKKFPNFGTAKILAPNGFDTIKEIDLASAREEIYEKPGKLPKVSHSNIQNDLKRRDFTINAMAVPVAALISAENKEALISDTVDYFNGYKDIAAKQIRILHDLSFIDDPTRIFRAARYAARIGGGLEPHTANLLKQAVSAGALSTISTQRKINEIKKILLEKQRNAALDILQASEVFEKFPLYPSKASIEVNHLLSKLQEMRLDAETLYQVALRVFFFCSLKSESSSKPAETYRQLEFGQNEIKKLTTDTNLSQDFGSKQTLQRVSKAGLIFLSLVLEGEDLQKLLVYTKDSGVLI